MEIFRQLLAVLLVLALLGAAVAAARRKSWRGRVAPAMLESRGKLALSARHSIHLIKIGDRNLIVALHPEGITFLGDFSPETRHDREEITAISSGAL